MRVLAVLGLLLALACAPACAPSRPAEVAGALAGSAAPATPAASPRWLCRPDRRDDPCRDADLSATELRADGSRAVVAHHAAVRTQVDCFYVYPTVDLELVPGNHHDLAEDRRIRATTLAQAARFSAACDVWVPLYRQVTLGTYLQRKDVLERGLTLAFADVERAFGEYLSRATGEPPRKIVLIGHSQGAEMIVRLLRRFFDEDPSMRERLLLAMPIGADVDVAAGSTRGGTLKNIPTCTRAGETGCVVAFRTYAAGARVDPDMWAPPPGRETVCVDPAALDRGAAADDPQRLARAYFAVWPELRRFLRGVAEVTTPFVLVEDFYVARCVRGPGGYGYLEVAPAPRPDDARLSPVDFGDRRLRLGNLGLHVLDLQLTQGDLVDMVVRRALAARPTNQPP